MARKSKYAAESNGHPPWRAGCYHRLSKEDGDKEESNSIAAQKELVDYYLKNNPEIKRVEEYTDDGWSGTNFERPGFQALLEDLKNGRINCVIVKDLSRLGRNYIEVGQYLEVIFPLLNVRFIAINDQIDSEKNPDALNSVIVPFKNIMNDEYSRDISNKIQSSLTIERRQGKFIGSFAPYGYRKDPKDHNHLIIDENVAPVIRDIFNWFLSGVSVIGIAKRLNENGVVNPSTYKKQQGLNYRHPQSAINDTLWPDSSVKRILKNRVYVGDMVQGTKKKKSYKLQKIVSVPEEDWIIVENTHEPIISREVFERVQSVFERDCRELPKQHFYDPLSGYLRCADCGRAMNRKLISNPNREYCYYVCATYKKFNKGGCTKHTIRSDKLRDVVLEMIQLHIRLAVSMEEVVEKVKNRVKQDRTTARLEALLQEKRDRIEEINRHKLDLYPDWKAGILSQDEYVALKSRFSQQVSQLEEEIRKLEQEITGYDQDLEEKNAFLDHFLQYQEMTELTREMVVELIDRIDIHEGGEITIHFRYRDEYMHLIEYLEDQGEGMETFKEYLS